MSNSRASVLLLTLAKWDSFESMNEHLLSALRARANVQEAATASDAMRRLSQSPPPRAVIATDAAVTEREHSKLLAKLVQYVKAGGILVFACQFSSFVSPPDLGVLFKRSWNVPWVSGSYHRTDFEVNPAVASLGVGSLVPQYSMKALHLKNVAKKAMVYLPTLASCEDRSETPAAFASISKGKLGYVGDVNSETGTTRLILAMCLPEDQAGAAAPSGSGASDKKTTAVPSTSTTGVQNTVKKPTVLVLSLEKEEWLAESYCQLYSALRKNATVHEVESVPAAMRHLSAAPPPSAVLATDSAISQRTHGLLATHLAAYVRAGGRLVLGCQFSSHLITPTAPTFFQRFGLPWAAGSYHRTTFALNPAGAPQPLASAALPPTYSMKALHIKHVARAAMVYVPTDESRIESHVFAAVPVAERTESPAVCARVGAGLVGYAGDVNGEQGSLRLLVEMCGVRIAPGDLGPRRRITGLRGGPGGTLENTYEDEDEVPLPAGWGGPAAQERRERPREREVALRAAVRAAKAQRKRILAEQAKEEGNKYFRREEWVKAAEMYHRAAMVGGPHPVYVSNLAAALLKLKMWTAAESAASRALQYDPKNVKARFRRGLARKEAGDYSGASSDFRAALRLEPETAASRKELTRVIASHASLYGTPLVDDGARPEEEDAREDVDVDSDSEDCLHDGNGRPCRFYNQGGCRNDRGCRFKHAPDDMSVRDEVARNVCTLWLLGVCADTGCAYAHDRTYLPRRGWWTDEGRCARVRECLLHLGEEAPKQAEGVLRAFALSWRRDSWANGDYYDEDAEVDEDDDEYGFGGGMGQFGFTREQEQELLCQGVKPWDDDAWVGCLCFYCAAEY
ncbi:hypothetical protein B0H21DRAFT_387638 [Amylocystis lapponica]|nr:hypothetical protein B0H21DRAFT_387638 [Amylocystis lapponica]